MTTHNEAHAAGSSRKVRLACRRCRAKRIKCDGSIPACGNCTRARVSCVDVDSRNGDLFIPRDYITKTQNRIRWLEEKLQLLDPDFDPSQGPPSEQCAINGPSSVAPEVTNGAGNPRNDNQCLNSDHQPETSTRKRSFASSLLGPDQDAFPSVEARSVAIDLGMISLHADSRQQSYLGSSSGRLFSRLIGAEGDNMSPTTSLSSSTSSFPTKRRQAREQLSSAEIYRVLYSNISKELPSPIEADTLFGVYFRETHIDYPFLHPPSLINAYNALAACVQQGYNGIIDHKGWIEGTTQFPYNGKLETVDDQSFTPISVFTAVSHVFLVFSIAATILTRTRNFEFSPTRFYKVAVDAAIEGVPNISLTGLQSVLLLTVQAMVGPADFNIWTLTHIAMSHCIDLGLHREPKASTDDTPITRTIKSLVFYTVYHLDRSISTIQGRPLGIGDETFDVQLPDWRAIPNENLCIKDGTHEFCQSFPSVENLKFSIHRLKLDRYISEIKLLFYHLPTVDHAVTFSQDHRADQIRIRAALDDWLTGIKSLNHNVVDDEHISLEEGSVRLHCKQLKLEVLYHGAITLLYQPSQVLPRPTQSALLQCYQSSQTRLRIYNELHDKQNLFFNWRNIHGIFAAGATIVFCFWASRHIQLATPFVDALRDLRMCSNLLSIGGQWWPSVRGGRESFDKIVDLTIRRLSALQNHSPPISHGEPNQTRFNDGSAHFGISDTDSSHAFPDSFFQSNMIPDPIREPETEDITSLMESFLADCLHGDWSWDPLSSFTNIDP